MTSDANRKAAHAAALAAENRSSSPDSRGRDAVVTPSVKRTVAKD
jgi:hypothetical protein